MIPYLTVRDAAVSLAFYENAFGFKPANKIAGPDGKISHAEMHYRNTAIMFGPENAWGATCKTPVTSGTESPFNLYFYVSNADKAFKKAVAAGCKVKFAPMDAFWGDRCCAVIDPDGYVWSIATNIGEFDPSKMPKQAPSA
jgi:uncharacterized glyoxalase superfamily protein PhnB